MNFCPECGTDLRSNQDAKFCFSCGNQLPTTNNVVADQSKIDNVVKANNNHEDNFDYFDFPEKKYFRDFMLEVMEHVETNPNLSNDEVAKKYFDEGKNLLKLIPYKNYTDFITIWNEEEAKDLIDDFSVQDKIYSKVEDFYLNDFEKAVSCFNASLFLKQDSTESHFLLFVCYHLGKDFDEAQNCLIAYVESAKYYYGLDSDCIKGAVSDLVGYSVVNQKKHQLKDIPTWIEKFNYLTR
jgi:tetratricopeptide (TPR) repeat protein